PIILTHSQSFIKGGKLEFTYLDEDGVRQLPLSSSPEIYDNSIDAWFHTMTNYDLSLIRFAFSAASELAGELSLTDESMHWKELYGQLPDYELDEQGGLTFAKGFPYNVSHRHFSNAMAIHPLGLIDWGNGEKDRQIIKATIDNFDEVGPDYWTGYSYSWFGNMKARAMDGEGAAKELRTFAEHFCLKNTFHANGDQTKSGKSKFTYRPFTLEGNFAFASGIQEMLLQSHTGIVRIFPAIPVSWDDVSFYNLRTYGAFLISAQKENGKISQVTVFSEKGGVLRMDYPFGDYPFTIEGTEESYELKDNIIELNTIPGQTVVFTSES
ncbi:glycosyl hydrolase family 95 catalytic domain-containing protein, partial [Proteiniphilum saccharofermentans]|uniref:glycosyl hydrolase family 95 catalytic domain-containing protein n=1 Tax=Proteiniphilum saccharofermentans TaxID=1642647 RepID=UPI00391872CC